MRRFNDAGARASSPQKKGRPGCPRSDRADISKAVAKGRGEAPSFGHARQALRDLLTWRRDVRRFQTRPLEAGLLEDLLGVAALAPSVGLSQPWRFVIVEDEARRRAVINDFKVCNADALRSYSGERAAKYAALKLSGLEEAPAHLAVFAGRPCFSARRMARSSATQHWNRP